MGPGLLVLVLLVASSTDRRRRGAAAGAGLVAVLVLPLLLIDGRLGATAEWLTLASSGGATGAVLDAVLALPYRLLEAPSAAIPPVARAPLGLGLFAALMLVGAGVTAARPGRSRHVGVAALLFLAITLVPPPDYAHYPTAYRYWQPALLFAAASFGLVAAGLSGRAFAVACLLPTLLFALGPGRITPDRGGTLDEALFATSVHRMGPHPGSNHATFRELARGAPAEATAALTMGYGLMLGHGASREGLEAPFVHVAWPPLLAQFDDPAARSLAMGVGFGLVAPCPVRADQLAAIRAQPRWVREAVMYGIHRALGMRSGPLQILVLDGEEAEVYAMAGDALRAAGRSWDEVEALGLQSAVELQLREGFGQPGGGVWESTLVEHMHQVQPREPCPR